MSKSSELKSLETSELYTVGWISALAKELTAALSMLDERHGTPKDFVKPSSDTNSYRWGRIGDHNIVIAWLAAGTPGTASAATTAIHMLSSFPSIKVGLMVGIGAGIPRPEQKRDIRLGDVVVSLPHGKSGGVIQYDLRKDFVTSDEGNTTHTFERVGFLDSPPEALLKALTSLRAQVRLDGSKVSAFLEDMLKRHPNMAETEYDNPGYFYQGQENDKLFGPSYIHTSSTGCDNCDISGTISRNPRRNPSVPRVHYGVIASGNRIVKDAIERDMILKVSGEDCICLEMEAAGLMNSFPCLVIRGICDYADSHKNDDWQEYAAATAAAYAKEFLGFVDNGDLAKTSKASEVLRQISKKVNKTAVSVKTTEDAVQGLRLDHRQKEIKDWLSAPDPLTDYTNALERRHKGTGLWFTHGQAFDNWKKQTGSFLWLHGIPGCGKTVLSSTIIEHLKVNATPGEVLLYFYFSFSDATKQTLEDMLRSLVIQLYLEQPDTRGPLEQLYDSSKTSNQRIPKRSLTDVLPIMLSKLNDVSIVLDAIDESSTRGEVLVWVRSVLEVNSSACRVLITARREEDIESALRHWTQREDIINVRARDVDEDIKAYVSHTVHNSKELVRWRTRPDVQEEIKFELAKKADGMFRWVACQLDSLKNCYDYPRLRHTLQTLPMTLSGTYTRILDNIQKEHLRQAITLLNLLIWSNRPLLIKELVDAIAINLDEDPGFDPKNRMPEPREVLKLCSSLVAVSRVQKRVDAGRIIDYQDHEVVRLAHFSVKEYLISGHVSGTVISMVCEPAARAYLARLCLTYLIAVSGILSTDDSFGLASGLPLSSASRSKVVSDFPFFMYSAHYWMYHAREAGSGDESLRKLTMSFFLERSEAFYLFRSFGRGALTVEDESPLFWASFGGVKWAVEGLLDTGVYVDADHGAALIEASLRGHDKIVQLLLDRGADVNASDGIALNNASDCGHDKTVQLLLDRGADVNANNGVALQYASEGGHDKTVQLLLDRGADIDALDEDGRSALEYAAGEGQWTTVRLLLERNASLTVEALVAVWKDSNSVSEKIFSVMLPYLTTELANQVDKNGVNILHCAVLFHSRTTIEKCLELGVAIDVRDHDKKTALHHAAEEGYMNAVRILVEAGADINAVSATGKTPLDYAKMDRPPRKPCPDVVEYLSQKMEEHSAGSSETSTHSRKRKRSA